ncbi:hypothetical protein FB451DRAFT_1508102 [Mycena latifolia]|nr:hypothetical protein FB451DRAFT_1508102 [Mycena latifolia]
MYLCVLSALNPSEAGPVAFTSDDAEEITSVAHEIAAEVVALLGPGHTIPLTQAVIEESLLESASDPTDWLKAYTGRERYDCTEDNFYYTGVVIGPQAWQAPVELRRVERFSYDYDTWDTLVVDGGDGTEERTKAVTRYGGKGAPFFCWEGPYLYFKDWMRHACPPISRWDDATFIQQFFLLVDSDHGDCRHRRDLSGLPPCISFQELFVEARSGSANTAAAVAAGARGRDLWPALARDFGAWMATRPDLYVPVPTSPPLARPPSTFPPLLPQSPLPPGAHTLTLFHSLPPEVLLQILPLLPLQDLCSLLLLSRSVPALFRPLLDETLWHHVHHGALYWVLPVPGVPGECRRAARVAKKWVAAAAGRPARGYRRPRLEGLPLDAIPARVPHLGLDAEPQAPVGDRAGVQGALGGAGGLEVRARIKKAPVKTKVKAKPAVKKAPVVKAKAKPLPKKAAGKAKVPTPKKAAAPKKATVPKKATAPKKAVVPKKAIAPKKGTVVGASKKKVAFPPKKQATKAKPAPSKARPVTKGKVPTKAKPSAKPSAKSEPRARKAAAVGPGTSNVRKDLVSGIPDFDAMNIRGGSLCGGQSLFYDYTEGESTVKLADNGFDIKSNAGFKAPAGAVCEHILELNILKDVMAESPGGPCQQIVDKFQCTDKPTAAEIKALVAPLVKIINGKNVNVVFAQKSSLEAQKGLIVEQALGRGSGLDVPGLDTANKALRLQGANDYLTRTSNGADGPNTLQVAANLDAEIQKTFPGTKAKVVDEWKKVLNLAKASA